MDTMDLVIEFFRKKQEKVVLKGREEARWDVASCRRRKLVAMRYSFKFYISENQIWKYMLEEFSENF